MNRFLRSASLLFVVASLAACSGTGPAGPGQGDGPEQPTHPAYETFDPAGYDAAPAPRAGVVHDVPARLMQGRVNVPGGNNTAPPPPPPQEPRSQQVEGYRVQIFTSSSRDAAEDVREGADRWWASAQRQVGAPRSMETMVAYLQPYYRVRIGGFERREDADGALEFVRRQFPEAFVVPDLVTVIR